MKENVILRKENIRHIFKNSKERITDAVIDILRPILEDLLAGTHHMSNNSKKEN